MTDDWYDHRLRNITKLTNYIMEKIKLTCLKLWALLITIAIWHTIINKHNLTWQIALLKRKKLIIFF